MVNIFKVIAHIRKVGWKQFREEFKDTKEETLQEPLTALKLQRTGYVGVIIFSIIASTVFFYRGMWYIGGIFIFNIFIQTGSFISNRNQIKMFDDMKKAEETLVNA